MSGENQAILDALAAGIVTGLITIERVPGSATRVQLHPTVANDRIYIAGAAMLSTALTGNVGMYIIPFSSDPTLQSINFWVNTFSNAVGSALAFLDKSGWHASRYAVRGINPPTVAVNANAGSGASAAVQAGDTDSVMTLTLTTGTASGLAAGLQCTITNFQGDWAQYSVPVISPRNAAAKLLDTTGGFYCEINTALNTILVHCAGTPGASTLYQFSILNFGR